MVRPPPTFEVLGDASVDRAPPGPVVFHWASSEEGLKLLEVEGALEDAAIARWSGAIGGAIKEGATGIAVDLRGCRAIGRRCLSVLLAASALLRARGGGGVSLVTYPGSALDRRLRAE